jgi:hypothetical protein
VSLLSLATLLLGALPARAEVDPLPLQDNRRITLGYIQLANELQTLLDPAFQPGGTSSVRPQWFCFAPHASQAGGKGMLGAALARRLLDAARVQPSLSVASALDRVGLTSLRLERLHVESLALQLVGQGLVHDAAAAIAALTTAMNGEALVDPRTLAITSARFGALYWSAPALLPLDKAERVVITFERTLHEGNLAIYSDIGGAGRAFLDWRQAATGEVTPQRVLTEFTRPGAVQAEAQLAYDYALAHAEDTPRPSQLDTLFPGMHWQSLLVAAFALYEESRLAPTPARRDALIAMGNNYVAWREQHDMAQPVFTPAPLHADEVSRAALLEGLTPVLTTDFGTIEWNYADYAYAQPDRDGNLLTSQPTEYSWAVFPDRWRGVLYAFELGYGAPSDIWVMPEPLEDPFAGAP